MHYMGALMYTRGAAHAVDASVAGVIIHTYSKQVQIASDHRIGSPKSDTIILLIQSTVGRRPM